MKAILLFLLASVFFQTQLCSAQGIEGKVDPEALEIFGEVMSPFCPGRLLNDCPSSAAEELRTEIQQELKAGHSKEQVVDGLYRKYGEKLRSVPGTSGIGLFGWLMPALFFLAIFLVMAVWLTGARKKDRP